jgi:hypothetical protein
MLSRRDNARTRSPDSFTPRLLYPVLPLLALDHWTTRPLDHSLPFDFRPFPDMFLTMKADVRPALMRFGVRSCPRNPLTWPAGTPDISVMESEPSART